MPRNIDVDFLSLVAECAPDCAGQVAISSRLKDDLGYDSLAIVALITAVEAQYNITLKPQDLVLSNFDTVESSLRLVERYLNA